ncbi:MAG: hypothetical protein ABWK53_05140 [Anaerolineales bacterium]
MDNVTGIARKVQQAPWRVQRQWLGLFLLGLVVVTLMAGLHLNITTRTALAGRELQFLQDEILNARRVNADLETQLANLTSYSTMRERALAMGFHPARADEILYIVAPGYQPPAPVNLARSAPPAPVSLLLPAYRQSLLEWFSDQLTASNQTTTR